MNVPFSYISDLSSKNQHHNLNGEKLNGTNVFPSIIDIKKVLPLHCFESSLPVSLFYVIKDFAIITLLYCSIILCDWQGNLLVTVIWSPVYWFLQGTMFWAVFVLGHDCGHGSFSKYTLINDIIGNCLHSFILVPYYPWKVSHKHHHKNTGNIDKDEIFYPVREKDYGRDLKIIKPLFGLGLSWFAYLFKGYLPRKSSHVNPFDPMFRNNVLWCSISIASVVLTLLAAVYYLFKMGVYPLISHYAIPVMIFASWLVIVTFLHHNDVGVPWYADNVWGNVKGQLSSVDRDYGWAHHLTHHIGVHQIHHLFIKIPHYHLEEAAMHFRKAFPHYVQICSEPIVPSFMKMFKIFITQRHISDVADIHVYK